MIEWIFYLPGIMFLISGLPQTIKLLKTKSSKDISIWTYGFTTSAIILILIDAIISGNQSLVFSNGLSAMITSLNLVLIVKYKRNNL